jgi:VWFA-related protein
MRHTDKSMSLQDPCRVMGSRGDKILREFAEQTGGVAYCPFSTIDVGRSFERIANELRNQYTLAYTPTNRARDGRYRHIDIRSRRDGLRVQHRPGYYATPEEAAGGG